MTLVWDTVRTAVRNVVCRSAPLTSVAQWMSGLFGHADLTPSDLVAALVLTAAAQQQRRRLHIKNALGEKLDTITEASSEMTTREDATAHALSCLHDQTVCPGAFTEHRAKSDNAHVEGSCRTQ